MREGPINWGPTYKFDRVRQCRITCSLHAARAAPACRAGSCTVAWSGSLQMLDAVLIPLLLLLMHAVAWRPAKSA